LAARRQAGNMPGEVDLNPIQVVHFGHFPQRAHRVLAHRRHGEIPQAVPPPIGLQGPVGMRALQRRGTVFPSRARPLGVDVHLADPMMPEDLQAAFACLGDQPPGEVDALRAPFLQIGVLEPIQELAGIQNLSQPPQVPPHAVDLRARFVDVAEPIVQPRVKIESVQLVRIVLHHDPPAATDRFQVLRREFDGLGRGIASRDRPGQRAAQTCSQGFQEMPALDLRLIVRHGDGSPTFSGRPFQRRCG